ncbi:MAG: FG-GAP-like repeat-containing protein [Pirellulales bacterium]
MLLFRLHSVSLGNGPTVFQLAVLCVLVASGGCSDSPTPTPLNVADARSPGGPADSQSAPDNARSPVVPRGPAKPGSRLPRPFVPGQIDSLSWAARDRIEGPLFESLDPKAIGIDFFNKWTKRPGQVANNTTGSGVAIGDYDGDGLTDVYLGRSTDGGRLYRNLGNFRFEDVSEKAGIAGEGRWIEGATFVDINNDGRLDLYTCGYDCPNHLYINQGNGTFTERAREYGLDYTGNSVMMAFADFDRDGDLDAYLVTNYLPPAQEIEFALEVDAQGVPHVPKKYLQYQDMIRLPDGTYGRVEVGQYDHLYRNNGDGTFTDVSDKAGISGNAKGLAVIWWDYNVDGWPDIYVANDFYAADRLYQNNGDGTFTDVIATTLQHTPWFSMGCDLGDINNDGWLDFMGTDMLERTRARRQVTRGAEAEDTWFIDYPVPPQYMRNSVQLNTGTGRFLEVARLAALEDTGWTWSVRFADLDQDGRVDIHITNGMTYDWDNIDLRNLAAKSAPEHSNAEYQFWEKQPPLAQADLAFRNLGDLKFEDVSKKWGLDGAAVSFGAAFGDLDNDGDLDLVVNNLDEMVSVYRNNGSGGGAIRVRLVGTESNRFGIGATARARIGSETQAQYLTLSRGFMSQSDPTLHFGTGQAKTIDELSIEWPSGHRQAFTKLPVGQLYTITEPGGSPPERPEQAKPRPLFARSTALGSLKHREKPFDDFARQRLLPARLSQLGPGLAIGDVAGNRREALFLGAGKWDWGTLLAPNDAGKYTKDLQGPFPPWSEDVQAEDMGLLFFDADGDGDQDLFVASGGIECEPNDELLRDRLYLNDGKGTFQAAPRERLPDLRDSDSGVAAADYDRDGDLDLAIGGRSIPGRFPETPHSRLLKNDGQGTFRDATAEDAPQLAKSGLVTSLLWSDANGDGWMDLLVTHEWGPIKLYLNNKGHLTDATDAAGLANLKGWWNGIAGRDLEGDGDIDYVATNLGRNTSYRVSAERPARLYYGDFTGEGRPILIEGAYDEQGRLVSAQNKTALQRAIPAIETEFPTFEAFASASLEQLVGADALKKALLVEANTVDSLILRNDGKGRFTVEPLPTLAQVSAGFGVVLTDFNGDGRTDAYLAQNSYAPRRELGRIDGGLSLLLTGDQDGRLIVVPPRESGLVVPGDAKSAVATDLNADGWPDLVLGVNDAEVLAFENQTTPGRRMARVRLRGTKGNPTAVGARITVRRSDGLSQTAEVAAGGGYLSQQSASQWFGLGESATIESIEVRWPNGQATKHTSPPNETTIEISQPAAAPAAVHSLPLSALPLLKPQVKTWQLTETIDEWAA